MGEKHRTSWIFGSFVGGSGRWDAPRPSARWHVLDGSSCTYCGLLAVAGMTLTRAWADGPPDGPVCAVCAREFVLALGMTPEQVSEAARRRHEPSENRTGVGIGDRDESGLGYTPVRPRHPCDEG